MTKLTMALFPDPDSRAEELKRVHLECKTWL